MIMLRIIARMQDFNANPVLLWSQERTLALIIAKIRCRVSKKKQNSGTQYMSSFNWKPLTLWLTWRPLKMKEGPMYTSTSSRRYLMIWISVWLSVVSKIYTRRHLKFRHMANGIALLAELILCRGHLLLMRKIWITST
jgi:hypothetical protein